jgi:hypothetical protein
MSEPLGREAAVMRRLLALLEVTKQQEGTKRDSEQSFYDWYRHGAGLGDQLWAPAIISKLNGVVCARYLYLNGRFQN